MLNKVLTKFANYKRARQLDIFVYSSSYKVDMKNSLLKLSLECYYELALCSMLNMLAFY